MVARVEKGQNIEINVRSGKEVGMDWQPGRAWGIETHSRSLRWVKNLSGCPCIYQFSQRSLSIMSSISLKTQ